MNTQEDLKRSIKIHDLEDQIQDLVDDIEALHEHMKVVEHSHAMLLASRHMEGPL